MIHEGSNVKWRGGREHASGKVEETFNRKVTQTINGNEVTQKAKEGNKALLIIQEDGQCVLKLESEVEKV